MLIIFGGSFNPPTKAHEELVNIIKNSFPKGKIIIVPVSKHNYTWKHNLIEDEDRYNMLKLQFPDIEISRYEFNKEKYEGTYELLSNFKEIDKDIYFIIGSDNLNQMPLWLNYDKLIKDFKFIVLKRETDEINLSDKNKNNFIVVDMNNPISSSLIRSDIDKYRTYLTKDVYKYIKEHHLYEEDV